MLAIDEVVKYCKTTLAEMQKNIFQRAKEFREQNTVKIDDKEEFYRYFTPQNEEEPEIHGGFAHSHWCGNPLCEEKIKEDLKVTIRCIPFRGRKRRGKCIYCGKPSSEACNFCQGILR